MAEPETLLDPDTRLCVQGRFETLGVIGGIGAYLSKQLGLIKGGGCLFPALNLCAASAVLISLTRDFNPFSTTIEISRCVINIIGMARRVEPGLK